MDDKTKGKPGKGKGKQDNGKGKGSLGRAKARARAKERVNNTARKGSKDFTKWRGTQTTKQHKLVKNTQSGRT